MQGWFIYEIFNKNLLNVLFLLEKPSFPIWYFYFGVSMHKFKGCILDYFLFLFSPIVHDVNGVRGRSRSTRFRFVSFCSSFYIKNAKRIRETWIVFIINIWGNLVHRWLHSTFFMVFDYGPISCYMLGLGLRSGSAKVISHDSHTRHSNFRDYRIIIQVSCINIKTFTFFYLSDLPKCSTKLLHAENNFYLRNPFSITK